MPESGKAKIFEKPGVPINPGPARNTADGDTATGGDGVAAGGNRAAGGWIARGRAVAAGISPQAMGVIFALVAAFLWSSSGMFIKLLTIDPLPLAGLRCAMAGALMAPFLLSSRSVRFRMDLNLAFLILFYAVVSLSFVTATRWTTAANAIALQSTSPAWVFLASCLLARRIFWRLSAPIAVILIGLAIIMMEPAQGSSFYGNLIGLASGLSIAGFIICYSRVQLPVMQVIVAINLAAALLIFLVQPGAFRVWEYPWSDWLILAYLGGFQVGLGFIFFYLALKRISTTHAAILSLLEPLLNPIWVYLAVGEVPSMYLFGGGALVLSGIAVDAWLRRESGLKAGTSP